MQLTVREVCDLFNFSENELFRLMKRKEIPSYQINHAHYFNRNELIEWALTHSLEVPKALVREKTQSLDSLPSLVETLAAGGIFYNVSGSTKETVLHEVVKNLPLLDTLEPELVFNALMARESLGSTAFGNGIAIPHVRNPIAMGICQPLIMLCFLKNPVDFSALDGKPVTILFAMMSTSIRIHLHLLSRLGFLLQNESVRNKLDPRATQEELISTIAQFEESFKV